MRDTISKMENFHNTVRGVGFLRIFEIHPRYNTQRRYTMHASYGFFQTLSKRSKLWAHCFFETYYAKHKYITSVAVCRTKLLAP